MRMDVYSESTLTGNNEQVGSYWAALICLHILTVEDLHSLLRKQARQISPQMLSGIQTAVAADMHEVLAATASGFEAEAVLCDSPDLDLVLAAVLAILPRIAAGDAIFLSSRNQASKEHCCSIMILQQPGAPELHECMQQQLCSVAAASDGVICKHADLMQWMCSTAECVASNI